MQGGEHKGTQVDLVTDRADRVINLCEMKFSGAPYVISKEYESKLRERMDIFCEDKRPGKAL